MTMNEINAAKRGQIIILVDTDTSKENVSRAAKTQGWQVTEVIAEGTGYRITISKE
jgi:TusA-related sulfurtransferase